MHENRRPFLGLFDIPNAPWMAKYGIFTYIYLGNHPNVGQSAIPGVCGGEDLLLCKMPIVSTLQMSRCLPGGTPGLLGT